jgi:hypothetical protein
MATIPCPGCRTALEPSATVCPICLRPRDKKEIIRAYATLRAMEKQRRLRPFVLAGYVLAAGATGCLLYRYHEPIIAASISARASASRFVDLSMDTADPAVSRAAALTPAPAQTPVPAQTPSGAPSSPAAPPQVPRPVALTQTSPVEVAGSRANVADLPLPAFDPATHWVFYGRVYDLTTLLPVPNAQLAFTAIQGDNRGSAGIVRSDADARFSITLPRLAEGSFEIRSSRSGYAAPALYESDIPYASLPLADRRDIVRSAQDGDMTLASLKDVAGESSVRRDIFLAPSR